MSARQADEPELGGLHKIEDAQKALRCSRTTIYNLAADGKLELVKIGRVTRVTGRSLNKLINPDNNNLMMPQRRPKLTTKQHWLLQRLGNSSLPLDECHHRTLATLLRRELAQVQQHTASLTDAGRALLESHHD